MIVRGVPACGRSAEPGRYAAEAKVVGVGRGHAIEAAWGLLSEEATAAEVREVEAKLIDGTWSVIFYKHRHADYVETPGFWLILLTASGKAEWFEVL